MGCTGCRPPSWVAIPQVLDGTIDSGRVFDRELPLSDVAEAYRLMDSREALKVLIRP